jgi:hypothetical protein
MSTKQNSELFAIKHTNSPIGEFAAQTIIISFVQSVFSLTYLSMISGIIFLV